MLRLEMREEAASGSERTSPAVYAAVEVATKSARAFVSTEVHKNLPHAKLSDIPPTTIIAPLLVPLSTQAIPAPLRLIIPVGVTEVHSPESVSSTWASVSDEHDSVLPPSTTISLESGVMAALAKA